MFAKWEWIVVELLVLGFLCVELVSMRRTLRRDRAAARAQRGAGDEDASPRLERR
jgi:hypothetical protein